MNHESTAVLVEAWIWKGKCCRAGSFTIIGEGAPGLPPRRPCGSIRGHRRGRQTRDEGVAIERTRKKRMNPGFGRTRPSAKGPGQQG